MIKKVISGGQTGADHAGIEAARQCDILTGGWMPKGFLTQDGFKPEMQKLYGMIEHSSPKYPPRTFTNVKESDGTIRFARNFNSSGELLTMKAISQYRRPFIDVHIDNPIDIDDVKLWIIHHKIETLNVAGNSESRAPGIFEFVLEYMKKVF
jgi:hypothetical protein